MTEEDIPGAIALWQVTPGITVRGADSPAGVARYLARNPGMSFVAIGPEGGVVGVCLAGHDGRRGFLNHVVVAESVRRHGIGRRLVAESFAALRGAGIEKVMFFVKVGNAEGKAFWDTIGCTERPELVTYSIVIGDDPNG